MFVTAQHCFPIFGIPDGSPAMVRFDPVITDASPTRSGVTHHNTAVGSVPSSDAHDVGVVVLSVPVTDRSPMNLPKLDELVTFQKSGQLEAHDPVRLVGYGAVQVVRPRIFTFTNERRTKLVEFQTVQPGFMVCSRRTAAPATGTRAAPTS